ncbi:MAG: hypothetical protein QME78_00145 [Thermodesulfobacteriota bacterium]|nr:hypothetical protein [Thermodesulfobacteriota bacterium]
MPPIRRVKRIKRVFTFAWDEVLKSQPSVMEGKIHQIHFRVPNSVNNVAATLTLEDEDDYEIYSSGARAEDANYNLIPTPIPLLVAGNFTFKVTLAGAPGVEGPPPSDPVAAVAVIYYDGI